MSSSSEEHSRLTAGVTELLKNYVDAHFLGVVFVAEIGLHAPNSPDSVVAPDITFVRQGRIEAVVDDERKWPGAPDLVAKVALPNDLYIDVIENIIDWLGAGVRIVVVVNPRKHTVTVYRSLTEIMILTEQDTLSGADVVPGWSLPVRDIFR